MERKPTLSLFYLKTVDSWLAFKVPFPATSSYEGNNTEGLMIR